MNEITNGDAPIASISDISHLVDLTRWVAWQRERRPGGGKPTKVPYSPHGTKAKADDPSTWGTYAEAYDRFKALPKPLELGGVGIELGAFSKHGFDLSLGGVDLDTCIDDDGQMVPWAQQIVERCQTYTEISPSLTGVKLFFWYNTADLPVLRSIMGTDWSRNFKLPGAEHPPGIELHLGNRYFAVTLDSFHEVPQEIRKVALADLLWIVQEAGAALAAPRQQPKALPPQPQIGPTTDIGAQIAGLPDESSALKRYWSGDFSGLTDQSRSAQAMALGAELKRSGIDFDGMCAALGEHPATASWVIEKGKLNDCRELRRIWDKVEVLTTSAMCGSDQPSLAVLGGAASSAPTLPVEAFGPFWGDWMLRAAQGANAPVDYTALALLSLTSALIGNARWAKAWDGWAEPPILWCCGVGDPSSGKTSGASPITRGVQSMVENWMSRDYAAVHDAWAANSSAAAARKKAWEKAVEQAVQAGNDPPLMPAGTHIEDEPMQPCVRVGNITIEQMIRMLAHNPKGLLCAHDELAQWFANFQRYSSGSDRPFWLESYNGGPFRLDRVSRSEPVRIPHLSVAIFGTVQPDRIAGILKQADDGLVSRFLFGWPESVPFRRPTTSPNIQAASDALCKLADLTMPKDESGMVTPSYIPLADNAAELLEGFAGKLIEYERRSHGMMKGVLGKGRGQTLRLALVLEFLWWCGGSHSEPTMIRRRMVEMAIQLMDTYFLPMARRVLADAATPEDERNARILARWLVDERPSVVNITAIRDRAYLPNLHKTDDVKAAVRYLVEAKWLYEIPRSGTVGRPPGDYFVNPKLWEALAAPTE